MEIRKKAITFNTSPGNLIHLDLYGTDLPGDAPAIVYIHGFKGFKNWGFVPHLAETLVKNGFKVITFNFSHNGIGDDFLNFTELEKFKQNTFSLEVEEAREIIHAVRYGELEGLSGERRTGILGHSRGGGIALLAGSQNPDVSAICTWAAVATFERYSPEIIKLWREQGHIEVVNSRTGQVFHLGIGLLEDLEANKNGSLSIRKAVEANQTPMCIIHGQDDEAVSVKDARAIFDWADGAQVEMHIIPETGHTFDAKHPFEPEIENPKLAQALGHTVTFFGRM